MKGENLQMTNICSSNHNNEKKIFHRTFNIGVTRTSIPFHSCSDRDDTVPHLPSVHIICNRKYKRHSVFWGNDNYWGTSFYVIFLFPCVDPCGFVLYLCAFKHDHYLITEPTIMVQNCFVLNIERNESTQDNEN